MWIKSFVEEFKSLNTDKMQWIVLFILPILTVILIGVEFSPEVITDIPMAVIDYDGSAFSRQLVQSFDSNETFSVTDYPQTEAAMEKMLQDSDVRVGMIIPKGFYNDVSTLKSPTVMMLYDGSHMSITSVSKSKAMEILLTYKAGATIKQLSARLNMSYDEAYNVTQAFQFTNRMLYNPSKSFADFLAPILMAGVIQSAIVLTATISINHELYQRARKERIGYAVGKTLYYTLMGSLSLMLCILTQITLFGMTFRGSLLDTLILSVAFCFSVASFCVLISAVLRNRMIALIGGGVVFIPNSIMAGTTWPLRSMPAGYQGFAEYMPFARFVVNLREVYQKGTSLLNFGNDVAYLIIFGAVVTMITEIVLVVAHQEEGSETREEVEVDEVVSRDIQKRVSGNI